jgi:hypothetical protein
MSTKSVARSAGTARPANPYEHDDVMVPLSEAMAAHWILDSINDGSVYHPEFQGWVENWALAALGRALADVERAMRKRYTAAPPAPPQAVA